VDEIIHTDVTMPGLAQENDEGMKIESSTPGAEENMVNVT
jgi:hypothetical protein